MANVEKTKGARGQTIIRSSGRDDSSFDKAGVTEASSMNGAREMGGSVTNLAHSLSGASAVQHVKANGSK